jgi:uncharacterized protein YukE
MSDDNGKKLLQKGGAGGYDIFVDTDALRRVAAAFTLHAEAYEAAVSGFDAGTRLPGDALGRLPQAHSLNVQYQEAQRAAAQAVRDLYNLVIATSNGLDATADVYDGADQPAG